MTRPGISLARRLREVHEHCLYFVARLVLHQFRLCNGAATIPAFAALVMGCGGDGGNDSASTSPASTTAASTDLDRVVKIDGEPGST